MVEALRALDLEFGPFLVPRGLSDISADPLEQRVKVGSEVIADQARWRKSMPSYPLPQSGGQILDLLLLHAFPGGEYAAMVQQLLIVERCGSGGCQSGIGRRGMRVCCDAHKQLLVVGR